MKNIESAQKNVVTHSGKFFEKTVDPNNNTLYPDLITGNQFFQLQVDVYFAFSRASPF